MVSRMKLLIVTQKVDKNDSVLGFFHRWLEEFAKDCRGIIVVCLEKGEYNLPDNVRVVSLGKETGHQSRLIYAIRFLRYVWKFRRDHDAVFVHMNPEYVVLGGLFWRLRHKRIALWYTHKSVNLKLRLAARLAHLIFTASSKSFRLSSPKMRIIGHGIDTDTFIPAADKVKNEVFTIINVGRITPGKNQLILVASIGHLLLDKNLPVKLLLIGAPGKPEDKEYYDSVKKKIGSDNLNGVVTMVGPAPHEQLAAYYQNADLVINLSSTGSLDKDVLEAAACNTDVLTSNEAYIGILPPDNLAALDIDKITSAIQNRLESPRLVNLRPLVAANYSLDSFIKKIVEKLS